MTKERTCSMCGASFEPNIVGRPSIYCGKECRDAASAFWLFQSRILAVLPRMTDAKCKELKGEIFRIANFRGVNNLTSARHTFATRRELAADALEPWQGELLRLHWSASGTSAECRLACGTEIEVHVTTDEIEKNERFTSERLRYDALLNELLIRIHVTAMEHARRRAVS